MRSFMKGLFALGLAGFAATSCTTALDAGTDDAVPRPAAPSFTSADADTEVVEGGASFTSYCASNKCPTGYRTCPNSDFLCDVNLLADRQNCGACGVVCPGSAFGPERYECVDGRCQMQCSVWPIPTLDCDGLPDNGCETDASSNDSCGGCGVICSDPAKPCINRSSFATDYGCGCRDGLSHCNGQCIDTRNNDAHCGACNHVCPRNGDGGILDPNLHMYYGCADNQCGRPKCETNWTDCDGNPDNGCETYILSTDNCGACKNVCLAGQVCKKDRDASGFPIRCMCSKGESYCSRGGNYGSCHDFASDPNNCGGCNIECGLLDRNTSVGICVKGICTMECATGQADCNRNENDGCEVNVDSDPRNCGGCGIVCDAVAGQACVQGRCVVEPCDRAVDAGRGPQ